MLCRATTFKGTYMTRTALVVGASVGGVRTAQELRRQGWCGGIVLVGAETDLPYDKPPLSKQLLAGSWPPEQVRLLDSAAAGQDDIELLLGSPAVALDVAGQQVALADGKRLPYDELVLATGAAARPSPWQPESGLYLLRTLSDAVALRAALAQAGPVVVVGGGFLGAEVASTAQAWGCEVTIVDPVPVPMGRTLGDDIGRLFTDLQHAHGVQTRLGHGVERVTGRQGDLQVVLTDGETLRASTVVVAIGAVPNDRWLAGSGLLIDDGVVCDAAGLALGAAAVHAVGDVARWDNPRRGRAVRVEHWTSAVAQAVHVAHRLTHPDDTAPELPVEYVWTNQHDWQAQVVGVPMDGDRHVVVGDPTGSPARFGVAYADGDRLCGALLVNWPKGMLLARRLLTAGEAFPAAVDGLLAIRR